MSATNLKNPDTQVVMKFVLHDFKMSSKYADVRLPSPLLLLLDQARLAYPDSPRRGREFASEALSKEVLSSSGDDPLTQAIAATVKEADADKNLRQDLEMILCTQGSELNGMLGTDISTSLSGRHTELDETRILSVLRGNYQRFIKLETAKPSSPTAPSPEIRIASLLLDKGAGIEVKNSGGSTPLHLAAWRGHMEVAALLLGMGAGIKAKDEFGRTPLHRAAEAGHKEVAALLLDKNAGIEAKDEFGWTPLHRAAEAGHKEVAALLLYKGADIRAKDRFGRTPLHRPAAARQEAVVQLLNSSV